ncbi:hypothetical protein [Mucilaginibacter sp. OK098]|uniref:hypothetical protein n=1 Tax=Mucilaginibacter sp. OK098 TaxID=1855297 RepID=UPI000910A733|nr:hypothetical protein [Mucilaginibacter sp. OK098]SHL97052.1 hypothetical protein SAMN05216524_101366 [Mucilaginibacter sp. OK098]
MQLETSYAGEIIVMLEEAQDVGLHHVVFPLVPAVAELKPQHCAFFDTLGEALQYRDSKGPYYEPPGPGQSYEIHYRHVEQLLEEIKQANSLTKENSMNRNNLENLTEEMKMLGLGEKEIRQMEELMLKNSPEFQLRTHFPGNKEVVDTVLHFKQSNQSDNYYLNKFHVMLNNAPTLEEGQKYVIITQRPEGADLKPIIRNFESPYEAVAFFKEVQEKSELVVGHMTGNKNDKLVIDHLLAEREHGKETYVAKEFNRTYRAPVVDQTFFVEKGRGFTVPQAVNMIQGRSVYRDDLLNIGGQPYKAWMKLDMDGAKDRHGNYMMNQYNDPHYGYDISKVLDQYQIKEVGDPAQKEVLIAELKNGNRPMITTVKDGEELKLHLEAVPRYSQVNFYQENGKPEKREQFETAVAKAEKLAMSKSKGKATAKQEAKGIEM